MNYSQHSLEMFRHSCMSLYLNESDYDSTNDTREHRDKILRAMIAFLAQDVTNKEMASKYNFVTIEQDIRSTNKLVILVSKT